MNNINRKNPSQKYISEFALFIITIFWGATFVVVKESINDISTMLFISFRFAIAVLLLLPFVYKNIKTNLNSDLFKAGIFLGILLFLGFAPQTVGLKYTTATKSGFITGILVVLIPIFQIFILKKKPALGTIIGIILVFLGIVLLSSPGDSVLSLFYELGSTFNFGDVLTLICAAFFALHVIYIDIFSRKYDLWVLVFLQLTTASVISFFAALVFHSTNYELLKIEFTPYLIFGVLYTAVFASLINLSLQVKFQKEVTPTKAGIIYSFEPMFAGLFAFFLLNEKMSNFGLTGGILIIAGLLVSELSDNIFKKNGRRN